MTIKTIWQPVPKWDVPVKQLERARFPKHSDEFKRDRSEDRKKFKDLKRWLSGRI